MELLQHTHEPTLANLPSDRRPQDSDLELVRRAQAGEEVAFTELVQRYATRIQRHCMRHLANKCDAEDVTQIVFSNVYRHLNRFEPRFQFATWLFRIATNACIDHKRQTRRMMNRIEAAPTFSDGGAAVVAEWEHADNTYNPESEFRLVELQAAIAQALGTLSRAQRDAFELAEYEGLKYEEIAKRLDTSLGSVKSRIYNARIKLMAALEPYRL